MGNHRAPRRGPGRRPATTPRSTAPTPRAVAPTPVALTLDTPASALPGGPVSGPASEIDVSALAPAPVVVLDPTFVLGDHEHTAELPLVRVEGPGKRRAVKHAGSRGPLFRGLPSPPLLLGVATLAIAVGGAVTLGGGPDLAAAPAAVQAGPASAMSGASAVASVDATRARTLSRDSSRATLHQASESELVEAAEAQARERSTALGDLAQQAEKQARNLATSSWVSPLEPIVLTARFGDYGLWASYHTGLDFNGETGDSIHNIAAGTVTFVGYDGSYGNKTVVTLEDGTEIWYCHQTEQYVSEGDQVTPDEIIGTVGATGNVTGSHLHIEVRPGGGDPVDPYPAFEVNGVDLP